MLSFGLLLMNCSRVEFSGCYMYRGSAAEISVAKYALSWNFGIHSLQLVNLTNCSFSTKREVSLERLKERERYVKLSHFFCWHVLGVRGLNLSLWGYSAHGNSILKLSTMQSVRLN